MHATDHGFARFLALIFITVLAAASILAAQQASGTAPPAKPSTNPLAPLLNDKPKASVREQELPTAPDQTGPIPLPDVAARSLGLAQTLRDAAAKLPTTEQVQAIETAVSELEPDLVSKQEQTKALLSGTPNSLEVREEENFWRGIQSDTNDWQQQLLDWANNAQKAIQMLDKEEPTWAATLEANRDNQELGPTLAVISANLNEIHKLRKQEQQTLQAVVNLQIKVGEVDQTAQEIVSDLGDVKLKLKGHLLDRDSLPLWQVRSACCRRNHKRFPLGQQPLDLSHFLPERKPRCPDIPSLPVHRMRSYGQEVARHRSRQTALR